MANWATRFRTERTAPHKRLPLARDPVAELFLCTRYACRLSRTQCTNRRTIALRRDFQAVPYTSCVGCETGNAHAAELLATPQQEPKPMEAAARTYTERQCARDRTQAFTPQTANQKACGICAACKEATGKPKARAKPNGNGKHRPQPKPRVVPILPKRDPTVDAIAWLEEGGFKCRMITTPGGTFLRLS